MKPGHPHQLFLLKGSFSAGELSLSLHVITYDAGLSGGVLIQER